MLFTRKLILVLRLHVVLRCSVGFDLAAGGISLGRHLVLRSNVLHQIHRVLDKLLLLRVGFRCSVGWLFMLEGDGFQRLRILDD